LRKRIRLKCTVQVFYRVLHFCICELKSNRDREKEKKEKKEKKKKKEDTRRIDFREVERTCDFLF